MLQGIVGLRTDYTSTLDHKGWCADDAILGCSARSLDVTETDLTIYDRINEEYGTNVEMRMKKFFEQQKAKGD